MKRKQPPSLYNADHPPKTLNDKSAGQPDQSKTPYLKSILAGSTKLFAPEKDSPVTNPDRVAALRYIKESALLKKLYFGKMSC